MSRTPWRWIDARVLRLLHDESIAEHGGAPGLRDPGLLESALARPEQAAHYGEADVAELASLYAHGLVKNHAFVDGNKRAAFLALGLFLALNGWCLKVSQAEATGAVVSLAAGELSEAEFATWLRSRIQPR
ncbi:type II toxin-antitoxin system death-on-curing family toxin [Inhella sp.]|uniref:type II toxin-antitoxin system death-on-curing family toxin n=1 Tax=Inhella sp. TaxID=1921806 RepID=UPI0035AF9B69